MSPLLARELRRLAPYGLGAAGLTLASIAIDVARGQTDPLAWQWFSVSSLLAPAVLGVATVAPDSSSGGAAFLVRLPLAPARILTGKYLAALGWFTAIVAATLVAFGWLVPPGQRAGVAPLQFGAQLCALGVGCLASAISPRVLPAVLLGPSVGLVCLLILLGGPLVAWGVTPGEGLAQVVFPLLGITALAAAGFAYLRGEPHRPSARPALLAGGVMGAALAIGLGATGVAHAWTVQAVVPELEVGPSMGVRAPSQELVAVCLHGKAWTGREERVALMAGPMTLAGGEVTVVLPQRGVAGPEFSPDGQQLLVRATRDPGGWLVDLTSGRSLRLPGLAPEGFGFPWTVWRGGRPVCVRELGDQLQLFLPAPEAADLEAAELGPWLIALPLAGRRLVGTLRDGRVVLEDRGGLSAIEPPLPDPTLGAGQTGQLPPPEEGRLFRWDPQGESLSVVISPTGSPALRVLRDDPAVLEVRHGTMGTGRKLRFPDALPRLVREQVGWSSEGRFAALRLLDGEVAVIDLNRVEVVDRLRPGRSTEAEAGSGGPVVWSSGTDAWVALPSGEFLDLRSRQRSLLPVPIAAGLGTGRFVPLGMPLRRAREGRDRVEGGAR